MNESLRHQLESTKEALSKVPTKREKQLYALIVLSLFFLFLDSCVIKPYSKRSKVGKKIHLALEQKEKFASLLNKIESKGNNPDSIEKFMRIAQKATQSNISEPSEAIHYFSDEVLLKGLKLTGFGLKEKREHDRWVSQKIVLSLAGTYSDVKRYIQGVSKIPILFVIEEMRIVPHNDYSTRVVANIEGRIYVKQDN